MYETLTIRIYGETEKAIFITLESSIGGQASVYVLFYILGLCFPLRSRTSELVKVHIMHDVVDATLASVA